MNRIINCTVALAAIFCNIALADDGPFRAPADRPVDIRHIALDLKVDIPEKSVDSMATIDVVALRDVSSIRFNAVDFEVSQVTFARSEGNPAPIEYINDGEYITILLGDTPLTAGTPATVTIKYMIKNPESGLHFFGPTDSDSDVPYVVWSQGESITNRYWVPCFDHPNEMQTTEMKVTASAGNEVISNGRLISQSSGADGSATFHWLQDKPHAAYLMTLIVGEFVKVQEMWRGKPVLYYVPPEHRDDVKRSFGNTTRMLEHFTRITGVEYPWDKYAQTCAEQFGGGMENTSATTLGTGTLHDERAHLDFSSDGLVAHELAHQWFGDLVTCKDWSHLWLNEGWASFMEPVWYEEDLGRDDYDYSIYNKMGSAIRGGKERSVVDRRYESPGQMFDSRSYPKGASILHMLRHRLGDDAFWACTKKYLNEFAHQPVETADFRRVFERETGRSLERFFFDWTRRPGAPEVETDYEWIEEDKLAKITVRQTQETEAFYFPLEVEFHFDGRDPMTVRRRIEDKEARFFFPLPKHPSMVLIDPNSAVLMSLEEKKGRGLWSSQLTKAPYIVSRIKAAKHLGESRSDKDVELLAKALPGESFWGVSVEIAEQLGESAKDVGRDALLVGMNLEHPKVRRACIAALGEFRDDQTVIDALYSLIQKGDPSYRVESAAIRAYGKVQTEDATEFLTSLLDRESHREQIRSAALSALGNQDNPEVLSILLEWTQPGKALSCRASAISALGTMAENVDLSDEQVARIANSVSANLKTESRWVMGSAMRMLGKLGRGAKPALPALRDVAAHAGRERTRKAAKKTIEKITKAETPEIQVDDLRESLKKLEDENETLTERIELLESLNKKHTVHGTE